MDWMELLPLILLGLFFVIALWRLFRAPLRIALRLIVNTLLGFLALSGTADGSHYRYHAGVESPECRCHCHSRPAGIFSAVTGAVGALTARYISFCFFLCNASSDSSPARRKSASAST